MSELKQKHAQSWINVARWAPSGGNSQPWEVTYEESPSLIAFRLSIDPEYQKNPSQMDVKGFASLISLGGFFTNLSAAAMNDGFHLKFLNLNEKENLWHSSAEFIFEKSESATKSFFSNEDLQQRRTDRSPYLNVPVPNSLLERFNQVQQRFSNFKFIEIQHHDSRLISVLSRLQKIRWQNTSFFRSLLQEIGFSLNDPGYTHKIPLAQLALSKMDEFMLRWMSRNSQLASWALKLGFHYIPVKKGVLTFTNHCDRIFFIETPQFDFKSAFDLGMCLQEFWLHSQSEKVSFQPCGDALIALAFWENQSGPLFSKPQIESIKKTTSDFKSAFGLNLHLPVLGFRIGKSPIVAPIGTRKNVHTKQVSEFISNLTKSGS